jgi:hypothetical protein
MDLSKITLSLYDIFGYLLPGYLIFVAASIAEASFTDNSVLFLGRANKNMIVTALLAYFLGVVCHAFAALIHRRNFRRPDADGGTPNMKTAAGLLDPKVRERVVNELESTYQVELDTATGLDRYLLADSYVLAFGGSAEREMLTSREGFFKSGTIALVVLAITLLAVALLAAPRLQIMAGFYLPLSATFVVVAFLVMVVLAVIFHLQFKFFNEAKRNNAFLLFLAIRSKPGTAAPK